MASTAAATSGAAAATTAGTAASAAFISATSSGVVRRSRSSRPGSRASVGRAPACEGVLPVGPTLRSTPTVYAGAGEVVNTILVKMRYGGLVFARPGTILWPQLREVPDGRDPARQRFEGLFQRGRRCRRRLARDRGRRVPGPRRTV